MKKIRLYLDSSVISALDDPKKPKRQQETKLFWEDIKSGKYEVVFSSVLFEEINKCERSKREVLISFIKEIEYIDIETNDTIRTIADEIVKQGILSEKHRNDRLHIGSAIHGDSDCIVSWNLNI
ncbi:MAG: PIN domain nuclease [Candidatus Cloacimonetes bacterium]|nr:PIN domain nuclease [Candidatus Cloacimonadota bacterium]